MKITLHNNTKNVIKGYNDMLYNSGPVKFSDNVSNKYNIVHRQLYEDALKGYLLWYIKNDILNAKNGLLFYLYKAIENATPYSDISGDNGEEIYEYIKDDARDDEYHGIIKFISSITSSEAEFKELLDDFIKIIKSSLNSIESDMISVVNGSHDDISNYYNYEHNKYAVDQSSVPDGWGSHITNFFLYTHDTIYLMEEYSPTDVNKQHTPNDDMNDNNRIKIWEINTSYDLSGLGDNLENVNTLRMITSEKGEATSEDDHDIVIGSTDTESSDANKDDDKDDIVDKDEYLIMLERFSTDDIEIFYDNSGNFYFRIKDDVIKVDTNSDDPDAVSMTNEELYNIIDELFKRIISNYNNNLLNKLANIIYEKFIKYHNCLEIKNEEYWQPSYVIITSKKRPYKKYGPIDLKPWWNNELVNKENQTKTYDKVIGIADAKNTINIKHNIENDDLNENDSIDSLYRSTTFSNNESYGDTIKDAEIVYLDYVKGKAILRSKISEIEYEVDFDDIRDTNLVSDELQYKPKFLIDYKNGR